MKPKGVYLYMSNVQKNNGKKKFKFNVFDVILLVIVAGCIIVGINMVSADIIPSITETGVEVKLSYTVTVNNISEEVADQLASGQTVYDIATGQELGTVSNVTKSPYVIKGIDQATGEQVLNEVPERVNVNITVYATSRHEDLGYYVNGQLILCGREYYFRTATVALSGVCVSMKDQ